MEKIWECSYLATDQFITGGSFTLRANNFSEAYNIVHSQASFMLDNQFEIIQVKRVV